MKLKWQVALVAAHVCACGCEPRVEEPAVTRDQPPPSPTPSATAPVASVEARCVDPLPPAPKRPVPAAAASCPGDPTGPLPLDRGIVRFAGVSVAVELAKEDEQRMRGLMYRTALGENEGMLFLFERQKPLRFWMRNTCLPLDMLFLDDDGYVVGIEENVPTLNDDTYAVACPSRYVLEVNAGWARRHHVEPGQRASFDGL